MANHLKVESLEKLIKATVEYEEELEKNRKILVNAANACDQAMGSDEISSKYIQLLDEYIEELGNTIIKVERVIDSLNEDRALAIAAGEI